MGIQTKLRLRSGALVLSAGLALSAAGVAAAESTRPDDDRATAQPRGVMVQAEQQVLRTELTPLDRIQVGAARRGMLVRLHRLYPASGRTRFPVGGAYRWGEAGARFGASRGGRSHEGQDVFAEPGTRLLAVRDGVVLEAGEGGGRGNYVALYSPEANRTYVYLHLLRPAPVDAGDRVRAGRRIGSVGCTGSCFGDHLHFEIRVGRGAEGRALDPLPQLRDWAR